MQPSGLRDTTRLLPGLQAGVPDMRKKRWLSWFFRDKIYRYLNIEFDKAIGKEKESWKGGIIYATYCLEKEKTHLEGILSFCIKENRRHIRFIRELP